MTLEDLHFILQIVMGWDDDHLHSWTISDINYTEHPEEYDYDIRDEKNVILSDVLGNKEKTKFYYTYDFGDNWKHEILVEKILPTAPDIQYPVCVTGKRACPPEDCGGPWGYAELLSIISNPQNSEYEERTEWLGDGFDPEEFDLKEINSRLHELHQNILQSH